ncbi:hypothetical protein [Reinekea blandensis]|uniref:Uncharacterized protein n=1 Tax=Reinekea blandensis MED297 TaxID=314283 RepID=A4BIP9_9GAMM|nr:hypothetical protein [Reinekea blandensis]EAR08013.1 hypothetical protein MED297_15625 [Reinekea sp. MED297] [Reinekea blandensis MED297]
MALWLLAAMAIAADFGVADWGMTPDEVKALETRTNLTPFGVDDYLIYSVTLPGIDETRIVYQFTNGQLTEGRFLFRPLQPMNSQRAYEHYQTVKTLISDQFGPPNTDELLYRDSADASSQLSSTEIANELASDRVLLKSSWRSPSSILRHQLAWNVNRPHHQLHYVPIQPINAGTQVDAF